MNGKIITDVIKPGTKLYRGTNDISDHESKTVLYLARSENTIRNGGYYNPNKGERLVQFNVKEPLTLVRVNDPYTIFKLVEHAETDDKKNAILNSFKLAKPDKKLLTIALKENNLTPETKVVRNSKVEDDFIVAQVACEMGYDGYIGDNFSLQNQKNYSSRNGQMLKEFHEEIALCGEGKGKIDISQIITEQGMTGVTVGAPNSAEKGTPPPLMSSFYSESPPSGAPMGENVVPRRLGFN